MTQHIDLDGEGQLKAFFLPEMNHSVQKGFPSPIAGKIIIRNEKPPDTLFEICPNQCFNIIGRP